MFRAVPCSSSGGPIVSPQPLVSSLSVNSRTVCRLRADCRFYAAVRSTNLLVKCGFDLVKKFVINLIIISAFLPPVLPPSSNCALSVYCCIPVPTYQQGLTALTCESINWLEWKGTSPYIQREKRIIPVNKLIFNNHNIINAGCLDLSSCFIFSAFFFFRLLFDIRVFGVDPNTVHARTVVYKMASWQMFISQYFSFPPSESFHKCSIFVFILMSF